MRYNQVAQFIRRFLKHSAFDTQAKRLGIVARVHPSGVKFWRKGQPGLRATEWEEGTKTVI